MLASMGLDFDTVQRWSPARRMAAIVAIGESKGGEFIWEARRWKD